MGERLQDPLDAGIEPALMNNAISHITGGEKNGQHRMPAQGRVSELPPVHPMRQRHIREEQLDLGMRIEELQRCGSVRGTEHA